MDFVTSQIEQVVERFDTSYETLDQKIQAKTAVIGVVGLGYVGLPLAVAFAEQGFRTVGIDLNSERVRNLNNGQNHIRDVADEALQTAVGSGRFHAEDNFGSASDIDIFFICVPTPVTAHKDPDTSYIASAAEAIGRHLRAGQLVILKSTTYPDTTEGLVQPILEGAAKDLGLALGEEYFLAFSPERIDPGNEQFNTVNTPVLVGGVTEACTALADLTMRQIVGQVRVVSSPKVAEMAKLLENIFRSVNIALVNELAQLCDRMGNVSIWEVVEAAATKPFGFMPFTPGPGLGGHCIPIDPYYLSWAARRYDFETGFITLSARTNEQMPFYVVNAVLREIAKQPVSLKHVKVLLLGVAFKKDIDDTRHSPALKILELLHAEGVEQIAYSDPYVPHVVVDTPTGPLPLSSVALSEAVLRDYDVVVITTNHSHTPYEMIAREARAIIDTRNAMKHISRERDNITLLGSGVF
jgi:UDP-N-acetyl-D-glucosamine dehydrogenase